MDAIVYLVGGVEERGGVIAFTFYYSCKEEKNAINISGDWIARC